MAPVFTLHHGEQVAEFTEHPTELARRMLVAAALVEIGALADHLRRFASTLPRREPIRIKREATT